MYLDDDNRKIEGLLEEKFRNSNIRLENFEDINVEFFDNLFVPQNTHEASIKKFALIGGIDGLLKKLRVDSAYGLNMNDMRDIEYRTSTYGKNEPILRQPKELLELIIESFEDPLLKILSVASIVSFIIGVAQQGWATGWMEGFSIFIAVLFVVIISSLSNLSRERQFAKLNKESEKKIVTVKRNRNKLTIDSENLLVGDIIFLSIGNIINVDCILINGSLEVDESALTGESERVMKNTDKPFLVSGSMITDGECEAIVCAIGTHSQSGKMKLQMQSGQEEFTPLQIRLQYLADVISKFGISASVMIGICIIAREIIIRIYKNSTIFDITILDTIVNAIILSITVIVVAVPEGLPMAVTIALVYSSLKLKEENNFVRHHNSSETMGNVDQICTDKTGTVTEGIMTVVSEATLDPQVLYKSIVNNSTAHIESKDGIMEFKGNSTEIALLKYMVLNKKLRIDDYLESYDLKYKIPFKSDNKYMGSAYYNKEENSYRVYIKGSVDIVFDFCKNNEKDKIFNNIPEQYAEKGQRVLTFAFGEVVPKLDKKDFKNDNDFFSYLQKEKNLTIVAILGISDPPRKDVKDAIAKCHSSGITVRMITGDNIRTAIQISREIGIITEYEYSQSKELLTNKNIRLSDFEKNNICALEAKDFRNLTGGYSSKLLSENENSDFVNIFSKKKNKKTFQLNSPENFDTVIKNLKVIATANPDDKFLLVLGLMEKNHIVAVTGDGTNDAPALLKSNVGFSMGLKGTDIAKEASDIILLNDNFSSIITAIKYGRNVYDCIRKFVQFQLTANIVAVFMTFMGGVLLSDSPLNSIQMLWVNLIMDSGASLALATEPPSDELLKRKPYHKEDSIITTVMMKNILSQAIYQIFLLTVIIYYGNDLFNVPSDRELSHYEWNEINGYHFTIFFHIFVLLQIYNSLNARKLEQYETNVFENITNNPLYLIIQACIFFFQILFVEIGGRTVRTKPLSINQHLACLIIGSTSLVVNYLAKVYLYDSIKLPNETEVIKKMSEVRSLSFSRGRSFSQSRGSIINLKNK